MEESQKIFVGEGENQTLAAEVIVKYEPLLIDISAVNKFLEKCAMDLANEVARGLNVSKEQG